MRPSELELEGFGAFRNRTRVSFDDAGYFALVGPTGAGKSTIIDAICFALYGSVPRYDNEGLVAPVVSQGALEAKVRLDFSINDVPYSAARVVRRQARGATTREARLERRGEVLAGNADEVTAQVVRLIGLTFKQFTKSVVLPQGEFARFLHDKPAGRQDLVVRLLNLGVYDLMRQTASQRENASTTEAKLIEERLRREFADASTEALSDAKGRTKRLRRLRNDMEKSRGRLQELEQEKRDAQEQAEAAKRWLTVLDELRVPEDIDELGEQIAQARRSFKRAEAEAKAAVQRTETCQQARAALPNAAVLRSALAAHDELEELTKLLEQARADEAALRVEFDEARRRLETARAHEQVARDELDAVRDEHAAHHLATRLQPGAPCPVCLQRVDQPPSLQAPPALERAHKLLERATAAIADAERDHDALRRAYERAAHDADRYSRETERALERVADHGDPDWLRTTLKAIEDSERALEEAIADERSARDRRDWTRARLDRTYEQQQSLRRAFTTVRDRLVPLGAPVAEGRDLAADWSTLAAWAEGRRAALAGEEESARARATTARCEIEQILAAIRRSCADCDVELRDGDAFEAVAAALARAFDEVARVEEQIKEAEGLRRRAAACGRDAALAHQLANHLSARHFEKWIVNEALRRMVAGASAILARLSDERYALTIDDSGNFMVIDHDNADEARSARTLSGGETFLASLALALALSDELADIAAGGAARLDAIFLDEGFGTLDAETLETVASTVEALAAGGRMVGIVTHVRELADRVPVRFKVAKDPRGARIERIET